MALADDGGRRRRGDVVPVRQIALAVVSLLVFLAIATAGFKFIEGWSWLDALYMVAISVTTVGYGEVHPLSPEGKAFAILTVFSGVGIGSYVLLTVTRRFFEGVVEGTIQRAVARRRVKTTLPRMKNHTVVAGFGRLGREICHEMRLAGNEVVVVDDKQERVLMAEEAEYLFVQGDASDEKVLEAAGLARAKSLAVATPTDALNTYIVLAAREVNPSVHILARASDEVAAKRMKKAGASDAVSPYQMGGLRMAAMMIRPAVVDFMDVASHGDFPDIFIEQLMMGEKSTLAGTSLRGAQWQSTYKVMVLSAMHPGGKQQFLPDPDEPLEPGCLLIVAGHRSNLDRLAAALKS
ncbi:MAG: potassium channel protein [Deltaproteobacteria bacterium]|nr:potassium channel protein [Deltaproteobacteria bacterium]